VSFDLAVLAMESSADPSAALAMLERCNRVARHPEGDIDTRITALCEALFAQFPVTAADSAWMTDPEVGIDHVIVHLSWSPRSGPVIETIQELARQHRLVLVDPQSDDVYLPVMPPAYQNRPETTDIEQ
jgi:hypothetical protein